MLQQHCRLANIVSLFCAWNIITVEINSGVYLLKSKIRQVHLFTTGGLRLGLGLKNLVLFTSLAVCMCMAKTHRSSSASRARRSSATATRSCAATSKLARGWPLSTGSSTSTAPPSAGQTPSATTGPKSWYSLRLFVVSLLLDRYELRIKAVVTTRVRLPFDCSSTTLQSFNDLRYDRRPFCCGLLHCALSK